MPGGPAFSGGHGFSAMSFAVGVDALVADAPSGPGVAVMGATSSALQLADLALVWDATAGGADLAMIDSDLASDAGMETAVMLSLFLDRRAANDDVPPTGDPADRRGWWADQFADVEGDLIGSRLWLLDRSKLTAETARLAKEYVLEALKWMIDDKVVSGIDVTIDIATRATMFIGITLQRPGRKAISFRFAHVWEAQAAA